MTEGTWKARVRFQAQGVGSPRARCLPLSPRQHGQRGHLRKAACTQCSLSLLLCPLVSMDVDVDEEWRPGPPLAQEPLSA